MKKTGAWASLACCVLSAACYLSWAPVASADVPHLIRYQGQAVDSQGVPLEGPYTLTFRLYDAETSGAKVWEEIQANVALQGGHFSVLLGQVTPLAAMDWSQPCWLSVQVGIDSELAPRQRITSVPMAIRAEVAETANTATVAASLTVPITTSTITDDANRLVPSGAIMLWEGASCPAGYTRVVAYDNFFLVGSATAGAAGGSTTHDHGGATRTHALTVAELPSHQHGVYLHAGYMGPGADRDGAHGGDWFTPVHSGVTSPVGGGQGHSHSLASSDHRPPFKTVLLCKKD